MRLGIGRGRSCTSVLVIPWWKTALVRAVHGRQPWADLKLHGWPWGLAGEEGRGREERGQGRGATTGSRKGGRGTRGHLGELGPLLVLVRVCCVRKKGKRKKRKGKNGKIAKPGNFRGEK
jgi:hypothetical protein